MEQNDRTWVSDFLERHGLPTLLLLLGAWYVSSNVLEPMTSTAKQFITDIREANVIIQDELMQIDRENLSRWDKAFDLQQRNRDLAEDVLDRLGVVEVKAERILSEFEKLRMLFTQPAIDNKGLTDGKSNYLSPTGPYEEAPKD
jgi:hypothetical protein